MTFPTLLDEGIRTARKRHQCFDCYRPVYPGETYKFTVHYQNVDDLIKERG